MLRLLDEYSKSEWETRYSSLAKMSHAPVTHEQSRAFSCEDIARRTTFFAPLDKSFIIEIPEGTEFHFIGRVDTNNFSSYDPRFYYSTFEKRDFVSFSTISHLNISCYKGRPFFIYNILPEDIAHVFPLDSDTWTDAHCEEELTRVPSLWLTLSELEALTNRMKSYNQITCKTRRNEKIIKPVAIVSFDGLHPQVKAIADKFEIGCIIVHPEKGAINYDRDLLYDCTWLNSYAYRIFKEEYDIDLSGLAYFD